MDLEVAIIGAGAAGIAAARRLHDQGRRVLLIEAMDRVGGRAHTIIVEGMALDLGCGWLHSAERNSWVAVADRAGIAVDRSRAAWGAQYHDLNFTPEAQAAAWQSFDAWSKRLAAHPPATDRAADALEPENEWNAHIRAIVSFISGASLEQLSAADYVTYDDASSDNNWRLRGGYGALIARSLPPETPLSLATAVTSLALENGGVKLATATGEIRARAVILTVSTAVLAGESIRFPSGFEPWREAARRLPLGLNEKLFLEITGAAPFENETHVTGNPRDPLTASYYIRPFGFPVIECFFGGERARLLCEQGLGTGFDFAIEQLGQLFGAGATRHLRPLTGSHWTRMTRIGGAYSYALPGHVGARKLLAQPYENRVFIAGEATSGGDFSTAHGAFDSGVRAATEVLAALASG